ncbi:MAG TPA: hypothetical protein VKF60_11125, partial [Myxococcota bacterium]|nr:hypothetical protein [Myxococcota bacterium]
LAERRYLGGKGDPIVNDFDDEKLDPRERLADLSDLAEHISRSARQLTRAGLEAAYAATVRGLDRAIDLVDLGYAANSVDAAEAWSVVNDLLAVQTRLGLLIALQEEPVAEIADDLLGRMSRGWRRL